MCSSDLEVVRKTNDLRHLEADLLSFADPKQLAQALKDYEPDDDLDPFLALDALMNGFGGPPPRPRRRKR